MNTLKLGVGLNESRELDQLIDLFSCFLTLIFQLQSLT
jgi:hypothetical protein